MCSTSKTVAVLVLLMSVAAAGQAPATRPSAPAAAWNDYEIILTRNMFVRDRASLARVRETTTQPAGNSESSLKLTGIVLTDDSRLAFFEDGRSGQTRKISAGQTVGKGVVESIAMDRVNYRTGASTRTVLVGETLSGLEPTSEPASASGPAAGGSGGSSNDIVERMRQRRLQETK